MPDAPSKARGLAELRLGEILASARRRARLSQRELAERLGLSQAAISRVESGERLPRLETLAEWARATGHRLDIQLKRPRARRR